MLGIIDLRTPQLAREIASPDTAVRAKGIDDRATSIVHIAARKRLGAAGWHEREFCVRRRQLRQGQHIFQSWRKHGPRLQIEAVVDYDGEVWVPTGEALNFLPFVTIDQDVDDNAELFGSYRAYRGTEKARRCRLA